MEMLEAILEAETKVACKIAVKRVAVMTMLEEQMWESASKFMRKHTPSTDPDQADGCPSTVYAVVSLLMARQSSISLLDMCFSFLQDYCTDQGMGRLWRDIITLSQHESDMPSQFLLAVQAGKQEICRCGTPQRTCLPCMHVPICTGNLFAVLDDKMLAGTCFSDLARLHIGICVEAACCRRLPCAARRCKTRRLPASPGRPKPSQLFLPVLIVHHLAKPCSPSHRIALAQACMAHAVQAHAQARSLHLEQSQFR